MSLLLFLGVTILDLILLFCFYCFVVGFSQVSVFSNSTLSRVRKVGIVLFITLVVSPLDTVSVNEFHPLSSSVFYGAYS